ncbi:type III secretion system ATPase SctN [Desulfospira joergensenii]|uniref:type III secretion system ATPase SctN n=1 Tax=Desulfospira joergensenii TaxID=53329 RepID=UPI0003B428FA|nr:type III secretion system ATPase SctN [Desulfospira joergensenii]
MTFDYMVNIIEDAIKGIKTIEIRGRVEKVVGTIIHAVVPGVKVGELCVLQNPWEDWELKAEVVGFAKRVALLTPLGDLQGISHATEVIPTGEIHSVPVGDDLLGRVLNGLGEPIDKGPALKPKGFYPVYADPPNPMERRIIDKPISLGLRVIDGVLTCGEGQRMGIFAAAGGGKSTLLSCLIKGSEADVCVLALIGERGREVKEFLENDLGEEGMKKAVIVCSTSDRPSMERLKAAYVATAVAEYFRDQGKQVLLMMDSVTRFGRALREIGLAAGEPPTRRGFPPSVFSSLPKLMERAGNSGKGSITALYTVLVEGDDMTEPIADETRSILDGHIILSRKLAAANHYPAIDVQASVSRVMNSIVDDAHKEAAQRLRKVLAKYAELEILVQIGEYEKGADAEADDALGRIDQINQFLCQGLDEYATFDQTLEALKGVVS